MEERSTNGAAAAEARWAAGNNQLESVLRGVGGWLTLREADALCRIVQSMPAPDPLSVVEIGSWKGRSTIALAHGLRARGSGRLYAIDPHSATDEHKLAGDVGETFSEFLGNLDNAGVTDVVEPLKMTSVEARANFTESSVHVLFIDGSHRYEDVRRDVLDWMPTLRERAVVAFNDPFRPGVNRVLRETILAPATPFFDPSYVDNTLILQFERGRASNPWRVPALLRLRATLFIGGMWGRVPRELRRLLPKHIRKPLRRALSRVTNWRS